MNVAIRYQSRGGHVKEMAEIIAEGAGVEPISIDDPRAPITKPVDILFIGGALYKFALDPSLVEYIENIPEGKVKQAIVFGSSALTRRPIYIIQEKVKARGIAIHPMALYMRGKPKPYLREIVPPWAKRELKKIENEIEEGTFLNGDAPVVQMIKAHEKKKAAKATAAAAEAEAFEAEELGALPVFPGGGAQKDEPAANEISDNEILDELEIDTGADISEIPDEEAL